MAREVQRGTAAPAEDGFIPKTELIGSLIAFEVVKYEPEFHGKFGQTPKVTVDLLVVDGPLAGQRDEDWVTFGNLASQMGSQPVGPVIGARVTSGPGSAPGSKWFGVDFEISDEEMEQVTKAVTAADGEDIPF